MLNDQNYVGYQCPHDTNLVFVFRTLVLNEELEALLPDLWLCGATTTIAALRFLVIRTIIFVFGFVRFANHFALATSPDDLHARFGITDMLDFISERGIRLT